MGLGELQGAPDHLCDRNAIPSAGDEVHHRRLEPVAGGEPLVLGGEDAMERRDLVPCVVSLRVMLDERLAQCGDRNNVLELRDGVADPDLDRPESWMQPDVPPDVRVVRDAAGPLQLSDYLRIV